MASGKRWGASEHLMPKQQKEARDTNDSAMNDFDDDPIPTQSEMTICMRVTVCTGDTKQLYVTPSSTRYECIRTNSSHSSMASNESIPDDTIVTLNDDDCSDVEQWEAEHLEDDKELTLEAMRAVDCNTKHTTEDPEHHLSLGATKQHDTTEACKPKQKERISSAPQPVIHHPWILPFSHYSPMDHNVHPSFATEDDDQGEIGHEPMGSHGVKCQICCIGSVQCEFKPCGHVTCRSCSEHFLYQPCPFCGRLVLEQRQI